MYIGFDFLAGTDRELLLRSLSGKEHKFSLDVTMLCWYYYYYFLYV